VFEGTPQQMAKNFIPGLQKDKEPEKYLLVNTKSKRTKELVDSSFRPTKDSLPFVIGEGTGPAAVEMVTLWHNSKNILPTSKMTNFANQQAKEWKGISLSSTPSEWGILERNISLPVAKNTAINDYLQIMQNEIWQENYLPTTKKSPNRKEVLDSVQKSLKDGKVVTAYLVGTSKLQAVVVYRAVISTADPNKITLKVWDSNYPVGKLKMRSIKDNRSLTISPGYDIEITLNPLITTAEKDKQLIFGQSSTFTFSYGDKSIGYYWNSKNAGLYFRDDKTDRLSFIV